MSNKENVVKGLQEIVRLKGMDVLKDENQVLNMITDLAPSDKKGKRRLRNLYEANTIPLFLGIDKKNRKEIEQVVETAEKKLKKEIGLSEDASRDCIRVLIDALEIPYIFPRKQIQTEQNTNIPKSSPPIPAPSIPPSPGPIAQPVPSVPSVKQKRSFIPFLVVLIIGILCMFVYTQLANSKGNSTNLAGDQKENSGTEVSASSSKKHEYKFYISDVTWQEANEQCKKMGGYLVNFNSNDEFNEVVALIQKQGYDNKKFYIGGSRPSNSQEYKWLDKNGNYYGAVLNSSEFWIPGDPSYADGSIEERFMMTYYYDCGEYWAWADVPNDVASAAPDYKGKIGYICEFEN